MISNKIIDEEVRLYVTFCENAAKHDEHERFWKLLAHVAFYHIQEMRSVLSHQSPIS